MSYRRTDRKHYQYNNTTLSITTFSSRLRSSRSSLYYHVVLSFFRGHVTVKSYSGRSSWYSTTSQQPPSTLATRRHAWRQWASLRFHEISCWAFARAVAVYGIVLAVTSYAHQQNARAKLGEPALLLTQDRNRIKRINFCSGKNQKL